MASCPERDFQDPRAMLRHLKHCKLFPQGKFWCPACQQDESFKVVSKRKCSWDKVNIARKIFQKSLKAIQDISSTLGGSYCYCSCRYCSFHTSRNDTVGNSEAPPPEYPISPAGLGVPFHQVDQAASAPQRWELPGDAKVYEIGGMAQNSSCMDNTEASRHLSCNGAPIPGIPNHEVSPSQLSSTSLGRSDYSSHISPASTRHTNESPGIGHFQPPPESISITMQPLPITREASQVSRRGEVPPLTVDTRPFVPNVALELEWNLLLDDGETLGPSAGMDGLGTDHFTPIIASQPNEILPLNTPYVYNESLVPHDNTDLYPSPSMSIPSSSNCGLSPSSSSGPELLQCHYVGCDFKPSGRAENLKAYLRKHEKSHEKNHIPCEYCDKTFTRPDNLTSHIRKVHVSKRRRNSLESLRSAGQPRRKESRREAYGA
ncbi:hypothetical protein F4824DRAFT_296734 [Ustulina deusta]|nr:hypothetical protein F4824DRAFT_296734 [Ustulina deusta]